MAVVMIDAGVFCRGREVAGAVRQRLGAAELTDAELFASAAESSGVAAERFARLLYGPRSLVEGLRRDSPRLVAHLRAAVAAVIDREPAVYLGGAGHLVPPSLTHVLKVCLGGTQEHRLAQGIAEGLTKREAQKQIVRDDELRAEWTSSLHDSGPWEKTLYDIFIAMQETSVDDAVELISSHATRPAVALTASVLHAVADFRLAAAVGVGLADEGHDVDLACRDGEVTILIKHHTMFLERTQRELVELARQVDGVRTAVARPGRQYREPGISFDMELAVPSKVLLVDDEQEFVHALSERLQSRQMRPAIAYDGEQALAMVASDEPEVMVLDLKMPGIDGMEVLRRVKRTNPRTEVIILTGHGSDREEVLAAELGAFAYLRKPVDIEVLTATMRAAYRRVEEARGGSGED
ncbi:MAG: response regulator [Thermoanaerobaculales bacterium]|nr:response regulator [Thermoanaerobaculales bacterium]